MSEDKSAATPTDDVGALISKEAADTQWPPVPADRMLQFFAYAHLPAKLSMVSKPFCDLAEYVVATVPMNPERTVALRKLLEAKDCAVRAMMYK